MKNLRIAGGFRRLNRSWMTIIIVTHDNQLPIGQSCCSVRDGKTSSERIMKTEYAESLKKVSEFDQAARAMTNMLFWIAPGGCSFRGNCLRQQE